MFCSDPESNPGLWSRAVFAVLLIVIGNMFMQQSLSDALHMYSLYKVPIYIPYITQ